MKYRDGKRTQTNSREKLVGAKVLNQSNIVL